MWPKFEDPIVGKNCDKIPRAFLLANFSAKTSLIFLSITLELPTVEVLLELTRKLGFKDDYERASERLTLGSAFNSALICAIVWPKINSPN